MENVREWDVKKIIISIVGVIVLLGVGYGVKVHVLDKQSQKVAKNDRKGEVAGESIFSPEEKEELKTPISIKEIEQKVDEIKKDVSNLKPEDIIKQEPVQKILKDLENIKSSTQEQLTDGAKETVCYQAKKIFCSQ